MYLCSLEYCLNLMLRMFCSTNTSHRSMSGAQHVFVFNTNTHQHMRLHVSVESSVVLHREDGFSYLIGGNYE